jgi:Spy/CpxP family protein refolding chaperone
MNSSKILVLALSLAFLPSVAFAKRGHGKHMEKILEELDLKPEQKTKIQEIHRAYKETNQARRDKEKASREAFNQAAADSKISDEKLTELHEAMINGKVEDMRAKFAKMLKIRAILDDQQRAEFQKHMEKRHEGKKGKRGKRKHKD